MKEPFFVFIVLNYNGKRMLSYCLPALQQLNYKRYLTVVVDNGSEDGSVTFVKQSFPEVAIIQTGKNLGWAGGNNVGIEYAKRLNADLVVLLNNDTKIDPDFPRSIATFALTHPRASIFAGKYYFMGTKTFQVAGGGYFNKKEKCGENSIGQNEVDAGQYNIPKKVDYVYEAALVARLKLFEMVGLLDPVWLFNFEGPDLCKRAAEAGLESWYVPQTFVEHEVNATFEDSKVYTSKKEVVHRTLAKGKNRFRFLLKHYPLNEALETQAEYFLRSITLAISQPNHIVRELYSYIWNFLNLASTLYLSKEKRENYEEMYTNLLNNCEITEPSTKN